MRGEGGGLRAKTCVLSALSPWLSALGSPLSALSPIFSFAAYSRPETLVLVIGDKSI
jgi:hypothetical protein